MRCVRARPIGANSLTPRAGGADSIEMATRIAAAAGVAAAALAGAADAKTFFQEKFDTDFEGRWTPSEWKGSDQGKLEWTAGEWAADLEDKGMMTGEDMRWHTISAPLAETLSTKDSDLVLQFSVKHSKKEYAFCGGGYIKLMPKDTDAKTLGGDTKYNVMFGPDLCGYDISRIHAIFEYNGENLLKEDEIKLDYNEKDEFTHVYTLVLKKDGTYKVLFDGSVKAEGEISEDWAFPSKQIDGAFLWLVCGAVRRVWRVRRGVVVASGRRRRGCPLLRVFVGRAVVVACCCGRCGRCGRCPPPCAPAADARAPRARPPRRPGRQEARRLGRGRRDRGRVGGEAGGLR